MQTVSQSWKDNHKQNFINESFVEVSLDIADPDALADASSEDNGAVYISDTAQVVSEVDKSIVPYSTLEQNMWLLDGSRKVIPQSDYGDCGYIGDVLSDVTCGFANKLPVVTVNFTRVHHNIIPGVTITWGSAFGEFAEDFIVTAYNGDTEVASKTVYGNKSVRSVVMVDIIDYDRITITVLRWCLPYRRVRIEEIFVGMNKVYSKSDLFSYSHEQSADPISTELPKAKISFSINNIDDSYNPYNENGLAKYLIERQEMKARYGYRLSENRIEWIKGGTYYLSEWDAPQNGTKANFTARDLLEFMSATFYEGVYNPNGTSLYDLALQVLAKANLPLNSDGTTKYIVDESLKNVYTVAPLPVDTLANCLQLIAHAGECVIYQDRDGILHIECMGNEKTDYAITPQNSYSKSDITLSKPLQAVSVAMYQYFDGENTELYNGVINANGSTTIVVTYSSAAKNVTPTTTGGRILAAKFYTNACEITLAGSGDVTLVLTGDTIKTSTTDVVTQSGISGEVTKVDNPLITDRARASAVGAWMESYLRNRMTLSSSWRADPRLDVLDVIENQNEYNTNDIRLTKVSYSYGGMFKGTSEGRVI